MKQILFTFALILFAASNSFSQIKNFLFVGMDRELLRNSNYWKPELFDGVQVAYSWRQLEHTKDKYDFSLIKEDLKFLKKSGKKLFIQIQDVSFSTQYNHAPKYLLEDPIYNGGANKTYSFKDSDEKEYTQEGWATRRWDAEVQKRLHKLYAALGKEFDGIVEGINTEETAVEFGSGKLHPPGFTCPRYKEAVTENLAALKKAFPKSTVIAYANFMPGCRVPGLASASLKEVYEFAWANNIGVGGPDLFPYKKEQKSYPLIKSSYQKVPTSLAVQDGNYNYINPQTNKRITAEEIYQFAEKELHLTYIFWGTENPFFKSETVPFLKTKSAKIIKKDVNYRPFAQ
ncbi:MAG: hypothetical protein K1X72_26105 [Pyrinomonadaceae bacterium]|nr:hypothetical protein [Pyrinomonadaceae bacterium]